MCEAYNPENPEDVNGTILLHQRRGEHLRSKGYLSMDPAFFEPDEGRNKETKRIQVFENDPVGTCNILDMGRPYPEWYENAAYVNSDDLPYTRPARFFDDGNAIIKYKVEADLQYNLDIHASLFDDEPLSIMDRSIAIHESAAGSEIVSCCVIREISRENWMALRDAGNERIAEIREGRRSADP